MLSRCQELLWVLRTSGGGLTLPYHSRGRVPMSASIPRDTEKPDPSKLVEAQTGPRVGLCLVPSSAQQLPWARAGLASPHSDSAIVGYPRARVDSPLVQWLYKKHSLLHNKDRSAADAGIQSPCPGLVPCSPSPHTGCRFPHAVSHSVQL